MEDYYNSLSPRQKLLYDRKAVLCYKDGELAYWADGGLGEKVLGKDDDMM